MEEPFSDSQLKNMSQESLAQLVKKFVISQKILDEKVHELEFLNALLSDKLLLAQKKQFGKSSEKYAEGFEQLGLFNETEQEADPDAPEPEMEEVHPAPYKRKKRTEQGKKKKAFPRFQLRKRLRTSFRKTNNTARTVGRNTKYSIRNPRRR